MDQKIQEQLEKDRIEWAPKDKEDAKAMQKQAEKLMDKGPSRKEMNKLLQQEEEEKEANEGKKKGKKNGWGKSK